MLIGGEVVEGAAAPVDVLNPTTEEVVAQVRSASAGQIESAVKSARGAFPDWKRTPAPERGEMLHALATWIREHAESLAVTLTREGGKPLVENRDEMGWSASCLDFYAEIGRLERGRVVPSGEAGQLSLVLKEPYGVVAAIVPWNYPILLLVWKLAPALAAGNTVVVKPSPYTPLSTLELCDAFASLFPPGVVNVVTGEAEAGAALVGSHDVSLVAFTGSVETGKKVMAGAAEQLKKVHLELGGKDAFIVCDDVDLEVAARGAVWAAYLNTGQVCTSAERFYVLPQVYDDFVGAFVAEAGKVVVGDPMDEATDVGPLVRAVQRDRVEAQLAAARDSGARVVFGGDRGSFDRGFFLTPAVVVDVDETMDLMRRETFGPVAPIARVADLDEAITRTNASEYGLGANVYTRRLDYMTKAMEEIEAGTVWFNDPLTDNEAAPFGGMKSSGNGRELGPEGLDDFRQTKHVHIDTKMDAKSWWYPYAEYAAHQAEHGTAPG
ncbi:MAG TPA: aldehyde dehydrogenase family protein [Actinomycetota bacterium]|nr:aldehyde dehydrogenase family protein [Actinomycetota bacterium]